MKPQTIVITGCSTGIGRDLAFRLAAAGHRVVATAREPAALADIPAALKLALDVTRQDSVDAAVRAIGESLGSIDALVNNAGLAVRSSVEETDEAQARAMFDVNLWGLLRMTKAVLPLMREHGRGRIIHVGSVVGRFAFPLNGPYAASKHALEALSDALRVELKPWGIPVVLIQPGTIDTHFMASSVARSQARYRDPDSPYSALYRRFDELAALPRRRGAHPSQVSRVIAKALEARRPRPRYLAAVSPAYRLMLLLGDRARDALQQRIFRIKAARLA